MEKTNIYGDISWWYIFDQMDREAHPYACNFIGKCKTANVSINYFSSLSPDKHFKILMAASLVSEKKISIRARMIADDKQVVAIADFLFIQTN